MKTTVTKDRVIANSSALAPLLEKLFLYAEEFSVAAEQETKVHKAQAVEADDGFDDFAEARSSFERSRSRLQRCCEDMLAVFAKD